MSVLALSACGVHFDAPTEGEYALDAVSLARLRAITCAEKLSAAAQRLGLSEQIRQGFEQRINQLGGSSEQFYALSSDGKQKHFPALSMRELFAFSLPAATLQLPESLQFSQQLDVAGFTQTWLECAERELSDGFTLSEAAGRAESQERVLSAPLTNWPEDKYREFVSLLVVGAQAQVPQLQGLVGDGQRVVLLPREQDLNYATFKDGAWQLGKISAAGAKVSPPLPQKFDSPSSLSPARQQLQKLLVQIDQARFHLQFLASTTYDKRAVAGYNQLNSRLESQLQLLARQLGFDPRSVSYAVNSQGSTDEQLARIKQQLLTAQTWLPVYAPAPFGINFKSVWLGVLDL